MVAAAGPSTPAVSQVGTEPGGGIGPNKQLRQGVSPGTMAAVKP